MNALSDGDGKASVDARRSSLSDTSPWKACIYVIRGPRVMVDADPAALYSVETRALIQAVKRNLARFP